MGKTTAVKTFIHRLLEKGWNPKSMFYYSYHETVDYRELEELLNTYFSVLGEITFVGDCGEL